MPNNKEDFLFWLRENKYGHLAQKLKEKWESGIKYKIPSYVPKGIKNKIRGLK